MTTNPVAVEAKGHVAWLGEPVDGVRDVDFEIRNGGTAKLHVTDGPLAARLRAALYAGDCIEILYEERAGPSDGLLIHIH